MGLIYLAAAEAATTTAVFSSRWA